MYIKIPKIKGIRQSYAHKLLLIMRLTTVILIFTMMQVSATFAQKITCVKKNITLAQLFKEIKKQTGYNVVWYEGKVNASVTINANFKNVPLQDVLDKSLSGLPLIYAINNNTVNI